jgi:hypothetical protein
MRLLLNWIRIEWWWDLFFDSESPGLVISNRYGRVMPPSSAVPLDFARGQGVPHSVTVWNNVDLPTVTPKRPHHHSLFVREFSLISRMNQTKSIGWIWNTGLNKSTSPISLTKIHHQNCWRGMIIKDFGESLGTSKLLDARHWGAPTEAYKQYGARRSDRKQRSRWHLDGGSGFEVCGWHLEWYPIINWVRRSSSYISFNQNALNKARLKKKWIIINKAGTITFILGG